MFCRRWFVFVTLTVPVVAGCERGCEALDFVVGVLRDLSLKSLTPGFVSVEVDTFEGILVVRVGLVGV